MPSLSFHHAPRLCAKAIIARYLSQQTARIRVRSLEVDQESFEAAGIQPMVAASLRDAFPNVRKPTAMQRKLIRAITKSQDVLLQDDTGTGKCVGWPQDAFEETNHHRLGLLRQCWPC